MRKKYRAILYWIWKWSSRSLVFLAGERMKTFQFNSFITIESENYESAIELFNNKTKDIASVYVVEIEEK